MSETNTTTFTINEKGQLVSNFGDVAKAVITYSHHSGPCRYLLAADTESIPPGDAPTAIPFMLIPDRSKTEPAASGPRLMCQVYNKVGFRNGDGIKTSGIAAIETTDGTVVVINGTAGTGNTFSATGVKI
jgi:hypothetical protein